MKLAALILLLANVAVFLWFRWAPPVSPASEPGLVAVTNTRHRLQILGGSTSKRACLLFTARMDATHARARAADLRQRGYKALAVSRSQQQASGYWVLLTGFKNAAAARAAADKLRHGGIKDLFVLGDSQGGATLSLGLFRDLDHARKRARHVRVLGFRPQIRERFRTTSSWTVQLPSSASARAAFSARTAPGSCRVSTGAPG
ncbi:MAG TPA: SPOR domain-containing protein [Gammaproteobacteria bacterium]|nr:SPOR domain-containing protein [Gammaproteobacteria bacterium]